MRAALITIFIASVVGGGGVFLWLYYGGFENERHTAISFIDIYSEYDEIAANLEFLVHLPGLKENTDRAELLALLESILTETMDNVKRETLARLAFSNLDAIGKSIDSAMSAQEELYQELQNLDNAARVFHGIEVRMKANDVVLHARKRAELSSHITALLVEINEQTYMLITRILEENGVLSPEHINELNEATNTTEERFSKLSEMYDTLIAEKKTLDRIFKEFVELAI